MKKLYKNNQWVDGIGLPTTRPTKEDDIIIEGGERVIIGSKYKWVNKLRKFFFGSMVVKDVTINGGGSVLTINTDLVILGSFTINGSRFVTGNGVITFIGGNYQWSTDPLWKRLLMYKKKAWWI